MSEEKVVESKTTDLISEWESNKPVQGTMKPDNALKQLQVFDTKFGRIKEVGGNSNDAKIGVSIEELQDLKGVWSELAKVWSGIEEERERQWLTVQPRKIRAALDALLAQMREMPSRLRAYDSYAHLKTTHSGLSQGQCTGC